MTPHSLGVYTFTLTFKNILSIWMLFWELG